MRKNAHKRVSWSHVSLAILASVLPPLVIALEPEDTPVREARLIVLKDNLPSQIEVGIHVKLAPGWYLYWLNPGDAGLAPDVRWRLPEGFSAGPVEFPTPKKFVHSGSVTYGFEDELLLRCHIMPPPSFSRDSEAVLRAEVDWMACRESCLTGKTKLAVALQSIRKDEANRASKLWKKFVRRFPGPLDSRRIVLKSSRFLRSDRGGRIEVDFAGPDAAQANDFYPYPLPGFVIEHSRIICRDGRLIVPVVPERPDIAPSRLEGILIIADIGHYISLSMSQ